MLRWAQVPEVPALTFCTQVGSKGRNARQPLHHVGRFCILGSSPLSRGTQSPPPRLRTVSSWALSSGSAAPRGPSPGGKVKTELDLLRLQRPEPTSETRAWNFQKGDTLGLSPRMPRREGGPWLRISVRPTVCCSPNVGKRRVSKDWPPAPMGLIVWDRTGTGARGLACEAGVRAEGGGRLCEVSVSGPAHCTRDGDLGEPEASGPGASASRGWKTPAPHEL